MLCSETRNPLRPSILLGLIRNGRISNVLSVLDTETCYHPLYETPYTNDNNQSDDTVDHAVSTSCLCLFVTSDNIRNHSPDEVNDTERYQERYKRAQDFIQFTDETLYSLTRSNINTLSYTITCSDSR